jgi:ubiquinone/menaquinone biosynthesis C-methylase UbiE
VGCGGGRLLERVLEAEPSRAAGFDHSLDMLELTRKRNAKAFRDGLLELKCGDASLLPWPAESFDLVVSANTFFFFERPELVLAEMHRVLAPCGRLVIATVPGPLPQPSLREWWVWVWGSRMHTYDDPAMREMLGACGLHDISITRAEVPQPLQLVAATREGASS